MSQNIVGYFGKNTNRKCNHCQAKQPHELVLTKKQLKIGPLVVMGFGKRKVSWRCQNCDHYSPVSENFQESTQKLMYSKNKTIAGDSLQPITSKKSSFPMMSEERREAIRRDNRKEGLMTFGFGIVIAILFGPFFPIVSYIFLFIAIFGGLYLAFEEPAKKHEAIFIKHGSTKKL